MACDDAIIFLRKRINLGTYTAYRLMTIISNPKAGLCMFKIGVLLTEMQASLKIELRDKMRVSLINNLGNVEKIAKDLAAFSFFDVSHYLVCFGVVCDDRCLQ